MDVVLVVGLGVLIEFYIQTVLSVLQLLQLFVIVSRGNPLHPEP